MEFVAPTLASETLFHIGAFEVRNTLVMAWLTMIVLIAIAGTARAKGFALVPGRFQAFIEYIIEGLFDLFDSIIQDRKVTTKVFPLVATFFLFIIVANWLGIVPGVGSITVRGMHAGHPMDIPVLRSMNTDVNVTLALSLISVIATQFFGFRTHGMVRHAGRYFVAPWKKPYGIGTFVGLLELIGEFVRLMSFTFRLFGNIFAGEVLLVVLSFLIPYMVPIPFLGLEIFVGFIQALVFTLLTLAFIKMSVASHGDHGDHVPHTSPSRA